MDLDRPYFLWLLPISLIFLWFGQRHSLARWGLPQFMACLILRMAVVTLVCLALAGPRWITTTREVAVVVLKDVSASISAESAEEAARFAEKIMEGREKLTAEVLFAQRPIVSKPYGRSRANPLPATPGKEATDLAAALEFAAAILPSDHPGRIVVLGDGIDTTGRSPLGIVAELAERGIEIDTKPAAAALDQEVALTALKTPGLVREGEVFDLMAQVHAKNASAEPISFKLFQNNLLISEIRGTLPAGAKEIVFPNIKADGRVTLYSVEFTAAEDGQVENNQRNLVVAHGGPARALVIDRIPEQSQPLGQALRDAGLEVEVRPPDGLPGVMETLESFDLVVFCDAPAVDFPEAKLNLLQDWVQNFGGGFLMIGGEESFGAGGYFRTAIATMLPVRIEREEREESPVVALLVILDRSGSMTAAVGDQTKMTLANEGAALALEVLQSKDLFGVFAVDTRVQEIVPLGKISDKLAAARSIAGITSGGGGIYIYTSLAEAFPRLRDVQAKIKHVILFSDSADAEEKTPGHAGDPSSYSGASALDLASAMLASRITLSVVALGNEQDRDTAFLRQLAAQGGGRFYLTPDATALPRLFTLETMRAAESSLKEDAFSPQVSGHHPALRGIAWPEAPPLLGLNISKTKEGAELLLRSEKGDPLLAVWRFGLGNVAAFTSDAKARWASEWMTWPGYGKFWGQVARGLVRSGERGDLSVRIREEEKSLVIEAEAATAEGAFRNGLPISVSAASPGAEPVSMPAAQIAPGLYRAVLKIPDAESAMIAVSDGAGRPVSVAWTRSYPAEYRVGADSTRLLQQLSSLTGGKFNPEPLDIFRPSAHAARSRADLSPWFLALAVLLWPVDIWLRRRDWPAIREKSLPPFSPAR